ncbi:MAG: hypothetical protein GY713_03485 [Actinomycetia bacterium]|nr:hypothetical protein [Actinomycetes bacterium]
MSQTSFIPRASAGNTVLTPAVREPAAVSKNVRLEGEGWTGVPVGRDDVSRVIGATRSGATWSEATWSGNGWLVDT